MNALLTLCGVAILPMTLPFVASVSLMPQGEMAAGDVLVQTVSAGGLASCAVTTDGAVLCWGEGTAKDSSSVYLDPTSVPGLSSRIQHVDSGNRHSCARTFDGHVWCWGSNNEGQLGDGTTKNRNLPVEPLLGTTVTDLSASGDHACVVLPNGAIRCWGDNTSGVLGDGSTKTRPAPVRVRGLDLSAVGVSTGESSSCAVLKNGSVHCWGHNRYGQLGDGTRDDRLTPVAVQGLPAPATSVAVGSNHACAVTADDVYCWGAGGVGQLGDGRRQPSLTPVVVRALTAPLREVSAGDRYTCAAAVEGAVQCWGFNGDGRLGDGSSLIKALPVPVMQLGRPVADLDAGASHACVALDDGAVRCWGDNDSAQTGDGTLENERPVPISPRGLRGSEGTRAQPDLMMARNPDGPFKGRNTYSSTGRQQLVRVVGNQRKTVTFVLQVQNDGREAEAVYLESDALWRWQYPVLVPEYRDQGIDVTRAMEFTSRWVWLRPGDSDRLRLSVTVHPRWIPRGGTYFTVWATSSLDSAHLDRFRVWAVPPER